MPDKARLGENLARQGYNENKGCQKAILKVLQQFTEEVTVLSKKNLI